MRQVIRACSIAFALLGSIGVAAGQRGPGTAQSGQLSLTPTQEENVGKGLASQPTQTPPAGYNAQLGAKAHEQLRAQPLPNNVTAQIPETKDYLFIKLPDRVLLIDPVNEVVAEIVPLSASTTGSGMSPGQQ
jgi:hypothetical protein